MPRTEAKSFFIGTAIGARDSSEGEPKQGAVIVRDNRIISVAHNEIIAGQWGLSAIQSAVLSCYDIFRLEGASLYCTYFPTLEDLKIIAYAGMVSINYVGDIVANSESVQFINKLNEKSISLEIIHLEKQKI